MSAPGRPKRECRSAQREGFHFRAPGRPRREYRSAQREGFLFRAPGRPRRERLPPGGTARSGTEAL